MQVQTEIARRLHKITRPTVPDIILKEIKGIIIDMDLKVGDKLPSERELSELLGVSRPSVRAALNSLETLKIIEIKHGLGAYLRQPDLGFFTFPMTVLLSYDGNIKNELLEARLKIELQILELAVERATNEDLSRIEAYLRNKEQSVLSDSSERQYNYEFEQLVGLAAKNRPLESIQKALHTIWGGVLMKMKIEKRSESEELQDHWSIYSAIKIRDLIKAKEEVTRHLSHLTDLKSRDDMVK